MNIWGIFFIINLAQYFSAELRPLEYPIYNDNDNHYIIMNLGSTKQNIKIFFDVSSTYTILSPDIYYFDESFTYISENDLSYFTYNKTNFKGYLSKEIFHYGKKLKSSCSFCYFFLLSKQNENDELFKNQKNILGLGYNADDSLSYILYKKKLIKDNTFFINFIFGNNLMFGNEEKELFAKENVANICQIKDKATHRWNCNIERFKLEWKNKQNSIGFKVISSKSKNGTIYFETQKYYNYIPFDCFIFLNGNIEKFGYKCKKEEKYNKTEIYLKCEESSKNLRGNITLEFSNFIMSFPIEKLFDSKGYFLFVCNKLYTEYIIGTSLLSHFSLVFDNNLDQIRIYNDNYLTSLTNKPNKKREENNVYGTFIFVLVVNICILIIFSSINLYLILSRK